MCIICIQTLAHQLRHYRLQCHARVVWSPTYTHVVLLYALKLFTGKLDFVWQRQSGELCALRDSTVY